jgi:hypothetical protein
VRRVGERDERNKNLIKDRWLEPSQGRQKRKAKERPKEAQPAGTQKKRRERLAGTQKKRRERASLSHGRKLFDPWPF